jgi:hypothetical protein
MKKQWEVTINCEMEVHIAVEADSEEEVRQWVASNRPSVYSAIETPIHAASSITLGRINENFARGFCPDIILPIGEDE